MQNVMKHSESASLLKLRGPASQILTLLDGETKRVSWEPADRRQLEIEIRARIIACDLAVGLVPVVKWSAELAHGDAVWLEPTPALQQIAGTPMQPYTLPARGMVWRTNPREFRLDFRNAGALTGQPMGRCVVQVSILPCNGQGRVLYPYEHESGLAVGNVVQPFPMGAREWMVVDSDGTPLAGPGGVVFVGVAGALFGPVPWAQLNPWLPIPHDAVGWIPSAPAWAVYR